MILKDKTPQWVGAKVLEKIKEEVPSSGFLLQRLTKDKVRITFFKSNQL